ncbi:MAG TPA: hypothetical protein VD995_32515 [Azospirillum sp.]|nr:hypothetical protein [Azospirillum sp.]
MSRYDPMFRVCNTTLGRKRNVVIIIFKSATGELLGKLVVNRHCLEWIDPNYTYGIKVDVADLSSFFTDREDDEDDSEE